MRVWVSAKLVKALILPTRDGNNPQHFHLSANKGRFDPTYKGWKPLAFGLSDTESQGFDPTYKGWKHVYSGASEGN